MADGKMEEDGDCFWIKCMIVMIKQSDPDSGGAMYDQVSFPTKKQALRMNPHTYAARDSKFEQLRFMCEHALDWRWETGWAANGKQLKAVKDGYERRGEPVPPHDVLFEYFKRENVYLMVKLPASRAVEYRMRFVGNSG